MKYAAFVLLVALTGCANQPPGGDPAQAIAKAGETAIAQSLEPSGAQVRELLAYFAAVTRLPALEQKSELVQAAQAYGRDGTAYARVKLGGLHALPLAGLRDDARALNLLEPLARTQPSTAAPRDRALADLALLLHTQVTERQRSQREDREARLRLQREEKEERQHLLREEARKQDALRERLDALKAIERSIMQREERLQPPVK